MEVILPYEIFLPSLRVQLDQEMSESEHQEALLAQLELLDEKRLRAAEHMQVYQNLLSKFYQKKVIKRKFKIGDMVVKRKMVKPGGLASKFQPNWEGPFVVKEAYLGNAYKLVNADGDELGHPWNGLYLKRFYPQRVANQYGTQSTGR